MAGAIDQNPSAAVEKSGSDVSVSKNKGKPFWPGQREFLEAQVKVFLILTVARIGDQWEPSFPRNDNENPQMFVYTHIALFLIAMATWTHVPPRDPTSTRVSILSRPQTEEWKGWMQFAFIMYHYYRMYAAYNWIRVFVSSYVWMTGFGNFLYFDKKRDFSLERVVSMVIRINYFPILLSWVTGVTLDLYYVVPLHTEGFFMTLITCRLAFYLEEKIGMTYNKSRIMAILISLLAHVAFYETKAVGFLEIFSHEIFFRFQADKYSAWLGIVFGFAWSHLGKYASWAYGSGPRPLHSICQSVAGVVLIAFWYIMFGSIKDKYEYNPIHPYVFIIPLTGWLMIRNSCKYLTEYHSSFLEFLGRNTLETYVLQFHLFMNHQVKFIPQVVRGSGPDGSLKCNLANMLLTGVIFVSFAVWARKITVTTQTRCVELTTILRKKYLANDETEVKTTDEEEVKPILVEEVRNISN